MGKPTKYSFVNLQKDVSVDPEKWSRIPSEQDIAATVAALEKDNIRVIRVKDGDGALERIVPSLERIFPVRNRAIGIINLVKVAAASQGCRPAAPCDRPYGLPCIGSSSSLTEATALLILFVNGILGREAFLCRGYCSRFMA